MGKGLSPAYTPQNPHNLREFVVEKLPRSFDRTEACSLPIDGAHASPSSDIQLLPTKLPYMQKNEPPVLPSIYLPHPLYPSILSLSLPLSLPPTLSPPFSLPHSLLPSPSLSLPLSIRLHFFPSLSHLE